MEALEERLYHTGVYNYGIRNHTSQHFKRLKELYRTEGFKSAFYADFYYTFDRPLAQIMIFLPADLFIANRVLWVGSLIAGPSSLFDTISMYTLAAGLAITHGIGRAARNDSKRRSLYNKALSA